MNKFLLYLDVALFAWLMIQLIKYWIEFKNDVKKISSGDSAEGRKIFKRIADMTHEEYIHFCNTGERPRVDL